MTPRRQTVCLCMIVRNEAPVIRRCLDSVRPIIDHRVIVDTGSTDGTQALVAEALRDRPGTLHRRPWRDFAHNRSEAPDLARPHGTFTRIIDADDTLLLPPGFVLPDLEADAYALDIADTGIVYRRTQLVRAARLGRARPRVPLRLPRHAGARRPAGGGPPAGGRQRPLRPRPARSAPDGPGRRGGPQPEPRRPDGKGRRSP